MKKIYLLLVFLLVGCSHPISIEEYKIFGERPFSAKAWSTASKELKAEMIYSYLLQNQPLKQLTTEKIKQDLGEPDLYFVQEFFPAYSIIHNDQGYIFAFSMTGNCGHCTVKNVYLEKE